MGLSGPEVIETARGVEEYDSRDRALVWRTVGGKHRYLLGECDAIVPDSMEAFRQAIVACISIGDDWSLQALEQEHQLLSDRVKQFGAIGPERGHVDFADCGRATIDDRWFR